VGGNAAGERDRAEEGARGFSEENGETGQADEFKNAAHENLHTNMKKPS
jgi:hypothetical protein